MTKQQKKPGRVDQQKEREEEEMEMQLKQDQAARDLGLAWPKPRPGRSATQAGAHLGPVSVSEVFFFFF